LNHPPLPIDSTEKMSRIFPKNLHSRWIDPKGLVQVFIGPRQVGKTTAAGQLADSDTTIFFSADAPAPPPVSVIVEQWERARAIPSPDRSLVLDEIQKIPGWSEVVKRLWDEDKRNNVNLRVAVLGSSALLIEKGLSESLTGRFEVNFFPHWSFREVKELAGASLEQYLTLGGYPKVYSFGDDVERALSYIEQSIIEPTLGRDILSLHAVDKPALLRQLFWYISKLPARIVSFDKILGSLQDRGNSATIAHYAELLRLAFLVVPLYKFSSATHQTKRSIPKWIFPNPALVSPMKNMGSDRGFLIENVVGAHLLNLMYGLSRFQLLYWRDGDYEIDFVVQDTLEPIFSLEVKSNRSKKIPTESVLKKAGLHCPVGIVNDENVEDFLLTTSLKEAFDVARLRS
jgi:predicted AAA+ superfamily ATPase